MKTMHLAAAALLAAVSCAAAGPFRASAPCAGGSCGVQAFPQAFPQVFQAATAQDTPQFQAPPFQGQASPQYQAAAAAPGGTRRGLFARLGLFRGRCR